MEIPNVVTPNGDNVNDVWVVNLSNLSLKEGFIVNRWGEVVKTFTDTIEWNGKINDNEAVEGVYFYQLTFYSEVSGEFTKHGTIQVFR
jgi:gliding motility-associated-like protein